MRAASVRSARQVIRQERYDASADVWSYGACLVHMATRRAPYAELLEREGLAIYQLMQRIAGGNVTPVQISQTSADWPHAVRGSALCMPAKCTHKSP